MLVPSNFFEKSFFDTWRDNWPTKDLDIFTPRAGIAEFEREFHLNLDLPGFKKDELHVEVKDEQLIVKGERRRHVKENDCNYYREERFFGSFERRFSLPKTIDRDAVKVNYANGVLNINMPKLEEAAPRKIAITGGE